MTVSRPLWEGLMGMGVDQPARSCLPANRYWTREGWVWLLPFPERRRNSLAPLPEREEAGTRGCAVATVVVQVHVICDVGDRDQPGGGSTGKTVVPSEGPNKRVQQRLLSKNPDIWRERQCCHTQRVATWLFTASFPVPSHRWHSCVARSSPSSNTSSVTSTQLQAPQLGVEAIPLPADRDSQSVWVSVRFFRHPGRVGGSAHTREGGGGSGASLLGG